MGFDRLDRAEMTALNAHASQSTLPARASENGRA
jgi:hypothetical protein